MIDQLIACGINPARAALFAEPLASTMRMFGILSLPQRASFIAQAMHESRRLEVLQENLNYRSPDQIKGAFRRLRGLPDGEIAALCRNPQALAAAAYSNLNGNHGQLSGDAWAYRGSGIFQLTGRANFQRAEDETGRPYVEHPELIRENPSDAALTAGLFWKWTGCNAIMDDGDFDGVSRVINLGNRNSKGIPNGNDDRREHYARCLEALAKEFA